MVTTVRAEAVITAQNKLRPGLAASARELERFRVQQSRAMSAFQSTAARAMAAAGGVLAGIQIKQQLEEAQKRFAAVDRSMSRIGITGDATVDQTRKGTTELRNLARETATLFDPAQKGLDAITASGRDFGDAMKMMPSVLRTAQASGAGVEEIANSSTALIDHMKISIEGLQEAQDTLAKGGKLGKFELKDMARYLPSMLPAFKALGASGQSGLKELVAMLQVIRAGTGTSEEAASSASNIFQKMESEETVKRFSKFGVDLRKEMTKARKEGRNLIEVFVELGNKAVKGDLSKLPQLFSDMEMARGMRALMGGMDKYKQYLGDLAKSKGTIDEDFNRVTSDAQANLDRFKEAADRAKTALGGIAAELTSDRLKTGADTLDRVAQAMERTATAVRDKGVAQTIADLAKAAGNQISTELDENRKNWQRIEDGNTVSSVTDPNKGAWSDFLTGDTSRNSTQKALDALLAKEKRQGYLSYFDKANKKIFEGRIASQDNAWSRDQVDRLGPMPEPLTNSSPEFAALIEAQRETQRGKGFSGIGGRAPTLPPPRPKDLDKVSLAPVQVLNDANSKPDDGAASGSSPPMPLPRPKDLGSLAPVQALNDAKSKADEVAAGVKAIGPAGAEAGAALAAGLESGFHRADAAVDAFVARTRQKLGGISMPGLGGFDTGRQGPN